MQAFVITLILAVSAAAASVTQDHAALRDGCDADALAIANLPVATVVTIRYALSGSDTPCYRVSVELDGKSTEGFLPAKALEGLETFEQGLREAAWLDLTQVMGVIQSSTAIASLKPGSGTAAVIKVASGLIETSQPVKALELLESQTQMRRDAGLLALAGVAAWRGDEVRKALDYWRESLDLQPSPGLEVLYHRVEREANSDQSVEKLYGIRVVLRYEATIPVDTARQMLTAIDQEFARISAELGCTAEERIVAIAQSREAYRKSTDAAEWSGGQFDGRIRVPLFQGQGLDAVMRRTLAHETTHACLTMLGRWPSWMQEGLAQKLSGDTVSPSLRQKLATWAREGRLPRLTNLGQDWSRLDTEHAVMAYGLSLAAIELFYQNYEGIRNLIHSPERLAAITADLDKRLGL